MPVFRFQLKVFTSVFGSNRKILRLAHASGKLKQVHNSLSHFPFPFMLINHALLVITVAFKRSHTLRCTATWAR